MIYSQVLPFTDVMLLLLQVQSIWQTIRNDHRALLFHSFQKLPHKI